jgi:hypothetical protein
MGIAISPSGDMPKHRVRIFREGRRMSALNLASLLRFVSTGFWPDLAGIALLTLVSGGLGAAHGSDAQSGDVDLSRREIGAPPPKFLFWRTGHIDVGHWVVVNDPATPDGAAIERSDTDRSVQPALAVYTSLSALNARIQTHFRLLDGSTLSAGVALRIISPQDYYLVRASVEEQRVSLNHVVRGVSQEIAGVDADIVRDHWQTLEVSARDTGFTIFLDGQWILTAFDDGSLASGQLGIWTERDDVTRFSQIEISPLKSDHERSDLQGRFGG